MGEIVASEAVVAADEGFGCEGLDPRTLFDLTRHGVRTLAEWGRIVVGERRSMAAGCWRPADRLWDYSHFSRPYAECEAAARVLLDGLAAALAADPAAAELVRDAIAARDLYAAASAPAVGSPHQAWSDIRRRERERAANAEAARRRAEMDAARERDPAAYPVQVPAWAWTTATAAAPVPEVEAEARRIVAAAFAAAGPPG